MFILRAYKYVAISFQLTHRFLPKNNKQAISQTIPDVIFACNPTLKKQQQQVIALKSEKRLPWHGPRRCAFYHIRRKKKEDKTNYLSPYSQIAPATSK
jgi:hypothetical protein